VNENAQKLATLATLLVVAAGVVWGVKQGRGTLHSPRPAETFAIPQAGAGAQTVTARLWQDPFEALSVLSNQPPHTLTNLLAQIREQDTNLVVLGVMLEGTSYPEDSEVRRRLRYAVEVALLTTGLTPNDRSHIGADSVELYPANGPPLILELAFEEFAPTNSSRTKALVLWLNEDNFANEPLETLRKLLVLINTNGPKFCLIGPRSSDTLRGIALAQPTNEPPGIWDKFDIHSAEATAPDSFLFPKASNSVARDSMNEILKGNFRRPSGAKPILENWITTDDQLSAQLVAELRRRTITASSNSTDVVVVISEADTFYGRNFPVALKQALASAWVAPTKAALKNIWQFSYLRGLDGIKPKQRVEKSSKTDASATPEAMVEAALNATGERAESASQKDYAERLADYLQEKDRELRRSGSGIRAVGLTGSDVYDKLLLLQALRPRLREAVFFTTDLDARLWMPRENLASTRNLIVASSAPLEPETLKGFLPFRDVYQSTVFNACRAAVLQEIYLRPHTPEAQPRRLDLEGKLFEIGRKGPVELSIPGPSEDDTSIAMAHRQPPPSPTPQAIAALAIVIIPVILFTILVGGFRKAERPEEALRGDQTAPRITPSSDTHNRTEISTHTASTSPVAPALTLQPPEPSPSAGASTKTVIETITCATTATRTIAMAAEAAGKSRSAESGQPARRDRRPRMAIIVWIGLSAFAFADVIAWARATSSFPGEEPWELTAGVSIWGTELVRAVLILVTIWFFALAHQRQRYHRAELWQRYFKPERDSSDNPPQPQDEAPWHGLMAWMKAKGWRSRSINWWEPPVVDAGTDKERIDATHLYHNFAWRGRTLNRFLRVIPTAAFYLLALIAITVLLADPPLKLSVRGHQSRIIDDIAFGVTIICPLIAFFYALDAARLTSKMLERLGDSRTKWPEWLTKKRAAEKCVRSEDVDGLLDVEVAAAKTSETAQFMYFAFIVLALHILSRSTIFENWTWPLDVCLVFFLNFLLACFCWWMVRRSAEKLRNHALARLRQARVEVRCGEDKIDCSELGAQHCYSKTEYRRRLKDLIQEIESERKGAFAHWIQDPALIALFVPTGLTGILTVLLQYWVTRH
jgi:hypothetical protein